MMNNKQITEKLIEHLKLGKPILNRRRKPISNKTAYKYGVWMRKLDKWFDKPFEDLNEDDVDSFRNKLSEDKIKTNDNRPYKESVKRDIEQKFLKTLLNYLGKSELALFITNYSDEIETAAYTREQIEQIVAQSKLREKVIFQLMFDGGFRPDEFLHITFKDIKDDCLKSNGYYKIRITHSKTIKRTVGLTLPLSTEVLKQWLEQNKDKIGTNQPLIKLTYTHLNIGIRRMGERVLKKAIVPRELRHSSATYYCHHLNRYQLCRRYGWSMNSKCPAIYIDREGVDDEQINQKVVEEETLEFRKQVNALQEQLNLKNEETKSIEERFEKMQKELPNMITQLMKESKRNIEKAIEIKKAEV